MATFIALGSRIVNLDLVTDLQFHDKQVNVYFAASDKAGDARVLIFKDEEAKALADWFGQRAQDFSVQSPPAGFSMTNIR